MKPTRQRLNYAELDVDVITHDLADLAAASDRQFHAAAAQLVADARAHFLEQRRAYHAGTATYGEACDAARALLAAKQNVLRTKKQKSTPISAANLRNMVKSRV